MIKNITLGIAILALLVGGLAISKNSVVRETVREIAVGGSAGPDRLVRQIFRAGFQSGGDLMATTSPDTASAYTLLSAEIDQDISYIEWTPNLNITLTTMASSSMYWLGENAGDTRTYDFYNASTTAASTITFAAGTGVDLQEDEGETVVVNGLEIAQLVFLRKSDSDVIFWVKAGQVGD